MIKAKIADELGMPTGKQKLQIGVSGLKLIVMLKYLHHFLGQASVHVGGWVIRIISLNWLSWILLPGLCLFVS